MSLIKKTHIVTLLISLLGCNISSSNFINTNIEKNFFEYNEDKIINTQIEPKISFINENDIRSYEYEYKQISSYNMVDYFKNLYEYSPNNNLGSCGYVSLIQLLSYYDTFINDNVIPSSYEQKNTSSLMFEKSIKSSPGVMRNQYYTSEFISYEEFCNYYSDSDLQSSFTLIQNEILKNDPNSEYNEFNHSIGLWNYQNMLSKFYQNNNFLNVETLSNVTNKEYINNIKRYIDNGQPVVVHILKEDANGNQSGHHSVVAYDYDENYIYANFGWGISSTHMPLLGGDYNYNVIYYIGTISLNDTTHYHSNNYIINGEGYCGCNLNDKVYKIYGGNHINHAPTLYWMKNQYANNENYEIKISYSYTGAYIFETIIDKNSFTIPNKIWKKIISSGMNQYFVNLKRNSANGINYIDKTSTFNVPNRNSSLKHITIAPSEYDITNQYIWTQESKTIIQGNYKIITNRKRVGYVENQNINLSANRVNAGESYIEYYMENISIYRIDLYMSFWDDYEGFYDVANKSSAFIQYLNLNNEWVNLCDLLNEVKLTSDRFDMDYYTFDFKEQINGFRIISKFENPTSTRNQGRICLGDLSIYFEE